MSHTAKTFSPSSSVSAHADRACRGECVVASNLRFKTHFRDRKFSPCENFYYKDVFIGRSCMHVCQYEVCAINGFPMLRLKVRMNYNPVGITFPSVVNSRLEVFALLKVGVKLARVLFRPDRFRSIGWLSLPKRAAMRLSSST